MWLCWQTAAPKVCWLSDTKGALSLGRVVSYCAVTRLPLPMPLLAHTHTALNHLDLSAITTCNYVITLRERHCKVTGFVAYVESSCSVKARSHSRINRLCNAVIAFCRDSRRHLVILSCPCYACMLVLLPEQLYHPKTDLFQIWQGQGDVWYDVLKLVKQLGLCASTIVRHSTDGLVWVCPKTKKQHSLCGIYLGSDYFHVKNMWSFKLIKLIKLRD